MSDPVQMESICCDLCGSSESTLFYQGTDAVMHTTDQIFTLVRCRRCGLVYMNPRPIQPEMDRYYPPQYEPYHYHVPRSRNRLKEKLFFYGVDKRARLINKLMGERQSLSILDIGCSSGVFLARINQIYNWDVHGVEPNQMAAQIARDIHGLDQVITGTLAEAHYPDNRFDVVTLWNVLEHLHSPQSTLQEIRRILKPGGLLVCAVPNVGSFDARLFKQYWHGFELPRHLYHFSPATLEKLYRKNSFRLIKRTGMSGQHYLLLLSLRLWMQAHLPATMQQPIERLWLSPMWRLLLSPVLFWYDRFNLGTVMTTYARLQK